MKNIIFFSPILFLASLTAGQDTFSIVAVDSATGQVGSAGASCISADNLAIFFPGDDPDFLGDLLPGLGAINTQSFYRKDNQSNARAQLATGKTPQEVINWLISNDAQGNPTQRQYGIAAIINGQPLSAAYTGANCFNAKGHRVGPGYAIQGNVLSGTDVLDSMETRFLRARNSGKCLAECLMQAMQGAKSPGADSRCLANGTSSMFAFIKVARPGDDATAPWVRRFVSFNPVGIEPIDSLQRLFDLAAPCQNSVSDEGRATPFQFRVHPNPGKGTVFIFFDSDHQPGHPLKLDAFDSDGKNALSISNLINGQELTFSRSGVYLVRVTTQAGSSAWQKIMVY